jgi:hypothetical protein
MCRADEPNIDEKSTIMSVCRATESNVDEKSTIMSVDQPNVPDVHNIAEEPLKVHSHC